MKILVISEQIPSRIGGTVRQFNILRELSQLHEISVVSYAYPLQLRELDTIKQYLEQIEVVQLEVPEREQRSRLFWQYNAWRHTLLDPFPLRGRYPFTREMRSKIRAITDSTRFDIIHINQAFMARFLPDLQAAKLLDMADILSEYERLIMFSKSKKTHQLLAWIEWKKMQALEKRFVRQVDGCITTSSVDKAKLLQLVPETWVEVVPNGVDLDYFHPMPFSEKDENIIFFGSMQYAANSDAVLFFYKEILPLIIKEHPDVHFNVVGWGPPPEITSLNQDPNVTVTGFVEDIRPYIAKSVVSIVPLRFGSGVRNKILEAWAMSKPVISTTLGAEGLEVRDGENILLADNPERFSRAVIELLENKQKRNYLSQAGRKLVENVYNWIDISKRMDSIYQTVLSQTKRHPKDNIRYREAKLVK